MMTAFEKWVLKHSKDLNLAVQDLTWIRNFFVDRVDISASIKIDGKEYIGRGHGATKDLALTKAVSEALERCICLESLETTNGVAAHTDLEQAKGNSLNELIERDLFLSHFLTNTPFFLMSSSQYLSTNPHILDFILKNEDRILFFEMKRTNLGQGVVCLIMNGKKWGGILGLSFGELDLAALCEKALLEAFRQYYHLQSTNNLGINLSINEFLNLKKWDFDSHKLLLLNPDYFQKITHLFPNEGVDSSDTEGMVKYQKDNFRYITLGSQKNSLISSCPIHVVSCSEPDVQSLYVGPWREKGISAAGLCRFGSDLDLKKMSLPHPLN